jgi:glycolate oxidase
MLPEVSSDEPALGSFEAAVRAALDGYRISAPAAPDNHADDTAHDTTVEISTGNLNLVVGAAVTLGELSRELSAQGVSCSAIPAAKPERTVGELIASASGDERLAVRHNLLGVEVVLPDGDATARFGGQNMKDVAGYDTKRLYIGGHHAFGTITSAVFKISVNK